MPRYAISGSLPVWVWVDTDTETVTKVEINCASEMYCANEAFTPDFEDVKVSLPEIEQVIQNVDWNGIEVTLDHQKTIKVSR